MSSIRVALVFRQELDPRLWARVLGSHLGPLLETLGAELALEAVHPREVLSYVKKQRPDVVIVDATLSHCLSEIRHWPLSQALGILVLVPDSSPLTIRPIMELGADTWATEHEESETLALRLLGLIRRVRGWERSPILQVEDLVFELRSGKVTWSGGATQLSSVPARILEFLLRRANRVVSREEIVSQLRDARMVSARSIDAQISKLKKSLPWLNGRLTACYGRGYRLTTTQLKNSGTGA